MIYKIHGGHFMRKSLFFLRSILFGIAFIIIVIGSYVIVAQTTVTEEWRANVDNEKDGKIHLNFERKRGEGYRIQFGSDFTFDELQGLSRE